MLTDKEIFDCFPSWFEAKAGFEWISPIGAKRIFVGASEEDGNLTNYAFKHSDGFLDTFNYFETIE